MWQNSVTSAARDSQRLGDDITVEYVAKYSAQNAVQTRYLEKSWGALV